MQRFWDQKKEKLEEAFKQLEDIMSKRDLQEVEMFLKLSKN